MCCVLHAGVHYELSTQCCFKQEMYSVGCMVLIVCSMSVFIMHEMLLRMRCALWCTVCCVLYAGVHYQGSTKCCFKGEMYSVGCMVLIVCSMCVFIMK